MLPRRTPYLTRYAYKFKSCNSFPKYKKLALNLTQTPENLSKQFSKKSSNKNDSKNQYSRSISKSYLSPTKSKKIFYKKLPKKISVLFLNRIKHKNKNSNSVIDFSDLESNIKQKNINIDKKITKIKIQNIISKSKKNICNVYAMQNILFNNKYMQYIQSPNYINNKILKHKNFCFDKNSPNFCSNLFDINKIENHKPLTSRYVFNILNEKEKNLISNDPLYFLENNKAKSLAKRLNDEDKFEFKENKDKKEIKKVIFEMIKAIKMKNNKNLLIEGRNIMKEYEEINNQINKTLNKRLKYKKTCNKNKLSNEISNYKLIGNKYTESINKKIEDLFLQKTDIKKLDNIQKKNYLFERNYSSNKKKEIIHRNKSADIINFQTNYQKIQNQITQNYLNGYKSKKIFVY